MSTEAYIPPPQPLEFLPAPLLPWEEWAPHEERVLEIGPGKGEFLLHSARENPGARFIGLELKKGRFQKIAKRARELQLSNLHMVRGDARECLPRLFAPGVIDRIYILFPDPWPKSRHAKHRLLKPLLIKHLYTVLKEKGEVFSATDAGFYSKEILEAFSEAGGFQPQAIPSPFPTYFEKKWRSLGREIAYWKFSKI